MLGGADFLVKVQKYVFLNSSETAVVKVSSMLSPKKKILPKLSLKT